MSDMEEKDPQLAAIVDKKTGQNMLDSISPLVVDLSEKKAQRFVLQIKNSPAGLIDLAIDADQNWLQPEKGKLTLVGGESGECIIKAKPEGEGDFATLLFSWEGMEQTLSLNVLVQRNLGESHKGKKKEVGPGGRTDAVKKLEKFIKGCSPDKFIDTDEENEIFRRGGRLEFSLPEIEAILNRLCSEGGWTRQTRLTDKLTAMLHEATKDDGVIDLQEFEHIVNFAVKRKMPRKDASCHCVILILDNSWKAKQSVFNKWFDKKRKESGV